MPTFTRTRKHFAAIQKAPLHRVSEETQMFAMGGGQQLGGQTPRAYERGATGTPPRQNSKSTDLDKTPPAEAKVLPWVDQVETGTIPDGMFGPYDSEPPSRMPTMHEAGVPEPRARIIHPFAYNASTSMPFAAVADDLDQDVDVPPLPLKDHAGRGREDEVMSRGAGMKSGHRGLGTFGPGPGRLGSNKTDAGGSPDGGTFGMDHRSPRKAATSRGESPVKSPIRPVPTHEPPAQPIPPTPQIKSASAYGRNPVPSATGPAHELPNLHRPHHDHPFSHYEAAQKQAAAVEQARAEALARLEAKRGDVQDYIQVGPKGPRGTYDTATSGPSFGHINHQDGQPTSARQSYQMPVGAGIGSFPMTRETGNSFFRIPFGVPMATNLPRPMMLMRTGTGAGMGLGIGSVGLGSASHGARLEEVPEASEASKKRDDRSAFVETVEDEQDPKTPVLKVRNQSLPSHTATQPEPTPARTESELNPLRMSQQTMQNAYAQQTQSCDPAQYPPQGPTELERGPNHAKAHSHASKAPTHGARSTRSHHPKEASRHHHSPPDKDETVRGDNPYRAPTKPLTIASDHRTFGGRAATNDDHPNHHSHRHHPTAPSVAPTTASNVKRIVKNSSFHDETLCELLEAARLNLIGPEAKKALQRAARARVIELKDIKEKGGASVAYPYPPSSGEKRSKSKAKESGRPTDLDHETVPAGVAQDESVTPKWALLLTAQMAELDARFIHLAEQQQYQSDLHKPPTFMSPDAMQDDTDTIPQELINDLIFHGLPSSAFTAGGIPPFFTMAHPVMSPTRDSPQSARIRAMTPSHKAREASGEVTLTWGSEVELPSGINSSPPKAHRSVVGGPTINVHPPTESNARTRLASIPSRTDPRTPNRTEIDLTDEQFIPGSGMADKSLPDTPDAREQSIRSTVQSPEVGRAGTKAGTVGGGGAAADYFSNQSRHDTAGSGIITPVQQRAPQSTAGQHRAKSNNGTTYNGNGLTHNSLLPTDTSVVTQDAVTAPTHFTARPGSTGKGGKDVIYVKEAVEVMQELGPWDQVTQRLYAWALVWEDESFTKALENLALGRQVDVMPLTVFSMMTFKRLLNRNLTSEPPKSCDKLFVPPIMAEAINKAVHNKQIDNARQILEELWYTWGFKTPPRVIIALAKHRNETEKWTAHRFDLSTGHLTTYGVTSEQQNLPDGRPFMWWHAIRAAWPEYHIPDPEHLKQRVEWVITPWEQRNDNSLKALNYARNLLLGFRPELARDLGKLRETVWEEVKRLLQKKRSGHLVVHVDSFENEI